MVVWMAFLGRNKQEMLEVTGTENRLEGKQVLFQQCFSYQDFLVFYLEWDAESEEAARVEAAAKLPGKEWMQPVGLHGEPFVAMELIFSYNRPRDWEHWKRKVQGTARGKLARVRPGMLGSYAYYHHVLQETTVRVRDKYGAIFAYGNLLFYYLEHPGEQEFPWYQGTVQGEIPRDWSELMRRHFGEWEDGETGWKDMKGGGGVCVTG